MRKWLWLALGCILTGLLAGWWISDRLSGSRRYVEEDSSVLLERIQQVSKLITVEGYFTELYSYKDYYYYDVWPLRKKALIRVKAKVSAGIDLSQMKIEQFPDEKKIRLRVPLQAEIFSVDTDLDYYDLSEGAFNSFSEKDYNKLQQRAREFIVSKAEKSDLMKQAREQGMEHIAMIRWLVESAGWQLEVAALDGELPG